MSTKGGGTDPDADIVEVEPGDVDEEAGEDQGWDDLTVPKRASLTPPGRPPLKKLAARPVPPVPSTKRQPSVPPPAARGSFPPARPSSPPPRPSVPPPAVAHALAAAAATPAPSATTSRSHAPPPLPAEAMSRMRTAIMTAIPKPPPVPQGAAPKATVTKVSAIATFDAPAASPVPPAVSVAPAMAMPQPAAGGPAAAPKTRGGAYGTQPIAPAARPSPRVETPVPPASLEALTPHPDTVKMAAPVEVDARKMPVVAELRARGDKLSKTDALGAARVLVELSLFDAHERRDPLAMRKGLEAALKKSPGTRGAVARLRRALDAKKDSGEALTLSEQELAVASTDAERAAVSVEHARLALASGKIKDARVSFGNALRFSPAVAGALFGLDTTLRAELRASSDSALLRDLAAHQERLVEILAPEGHSAGGSRDRALAAFFAIERAQLLEQRLGQPDQAETSLRRAVALVPEPGPARDTLRRHLATRGAYGALAAETVAEANVEEDDDRAARLFYFAARLTSDKLGQGTGAADLLIAAAKRAPARGTTARRTLDELLRLLVATGKPEAAVDVRLRRMDLLHDTDAIRHEHLRLVDLLDGIGLTEDAVKHAKEALHQKPDDDTVRERLDLLLEKLGRHEERVILWRTKGETADTPKARVAGYLRAAEMAESLLGRDDDALVFLRAAFDLQPDAHEPLDRLSALVTPAVQDPASRRAIRTRIELCGSAMRATKDVARKVALHERVASLWEEAGESERAVRILQKALELEPNRRTALLGIQRNAGRAGDHTALAEALAAESALTEDPLLARVLLLRAARLYDGPLGDTATALKLVERAAAIDGSDPDVLRARIRLGEKIGRLDDVRNARLALVHVEPAAAFDQWTAIALLDEHRRKRPDDAVLAYREAAKRKPGHVLPEEEIIRLLRAAGAHESLADNLATLAAAASHSETRARLYFQASEIQELCLGNEEAAIRSLGLAEAALGKRQLDEAIFESQERLLLRKAARPGDTTAKPDLVALYTRWIEAGPPQRTVHRLRLALASSLPAVDAKRSEEALRAATQAVPGDVHALAALALLQRQPGAQSQLATTLTMLAQSCRGAAATCAVLWELVRLDEQIGPEATFRTLEQLVAGDTEDPATVDAVLRVGGKLLLGAQVSPQVSALYVGALRKRREGRWDAVEKAFLYLEEALVLERLSGGTPEALAAYRQALDLHPGSLLAARGVERLSELHGDIEGQSRAHAALARLLEGRALRAAHLTRAAALVERTDVETALLHLEEALREDPDAQGAAEALARLLHQSPDRLVHVFADALAAAETAPQRRALGLSMGEAALRRATAQGSPADIGPGITAVIRVTEDNPADVSALWLLGRLYAAAELPTEAERALARCIACTDADSIRLSACFALATLREAVLKNPAAAEHALAAALTIDPCETEALARYQRLAKMRGDLALADQLLTRLVILTEDNAQRAQRALDLSSIRTALSDEAGAIAALVDAVVSVPDGTEAWEALASRFRSDRHEGAVAYTDALAQVLRVAGSRAVDPRPRWLVTTGVLLASFRIDPARGIELLRRAAAMPRGGPDAAIALGRALDGLGSSAEAARVLRHTIATDEALRRFGAPLAHALTVLEGALAKEGRVDERVAVEEARACVGDASRGRLTALIGRPFPHEGLPPLSMQPRELARFFPEIGHPLFAIAGIVAPTLHKPLRTDLASLGLVSREKLGSRDAHPIRWLVDRLSRAFAVEPVDIYLSGSATSALIVSGEPHALVVPLPLLEQPELEQMTALAMAFARLGVSGSLFAEIPPETLDAVLLASLLEGGHALPERELSAARRHALDGMVPIVKKAVGRKQRQRLEAVELPRGFLPDSVSLAKSLQGFLHIVACLASGSIAATLAHLARTDRELASSLGASAAFCERSVHGDLLCFHISAEAAAERARLGSATINPP